MKKLLFVVLSLILALLFAMNGCSCAVTPPLEFTKAYLGESGNANYSEILEYSVGYQSSYQSITNSSNVDNAKIPDYKGTYVVEFSNSLNFVLPDGITTDIDYEEQSYHYLKSTLSLDVTFNGKTYNDKIISEVYFYSKDWSLAPVYSKTTMKNTYLSLTSESVDQKIYQFSVLYNKDKYTLTKTYYNSEENEDINLIDITNTDVNSPNYFNTAKLVAMSGNGNSHEYNIRTVIDNAQLMFAMRNSNVDTLTLPTLSFAYEQPIDISASYKNEANYTFDSLIYNGENKDNTNMTVKNIEFFINATNNRGSAKYVTIQKEAVKDIKNNALIVEYAEPLLSGLSNIGALVYKLNKVTINN